MGKIIKNGIEYGGAPLPTASSQVVGGVKVGNGLSIAPDGTLSTQGGGGGASSLGQLSDVDITTTPPESGNVLTYNGIFWVPQAPGGGGGGGGGSTGLQKRHLTAGTYTAPFSQSITLNFTASQAPSHSGVFLLDFAPYVVLTDGTNEYNLSGRIQFPVEVTVNDSHEITFLYGSSEYKLLYGSGPSFTPFMFSANATAQFMNSTIQVELTINDAAVVMTSSEITPMSIGALSVDRWDSMYTNAALIG